MRSLLVLAVVATVAAQVVACEPAPLPIDRPVGAPSGSRLVFHSSFDGASLDRTAWRSGLPWYPESGGVGADHSELQWYRPLQARIRDGAVHLVAERASAVRGPNGGKRFVSGMLTTASRFEFRYGFVQFRARVPAGRGLWPALWLLPADETNPPEIDALEAVGQDPTTAHMHYHGRVGTFGKTVPNVSRSWHTYAVNWQPGRITYFIDGVVRWVVAAFDCNKPMYLLMNLAVGGDYPGRPDDATPFPSSFDVADVQVWRT